MAMHKIRLTEAEEFFYRNAGYSRAMDEPAYSGKTRGAILLADAEAHAERHDWVYRWEIDADADITPTDSYFVSGAEHWECVLFNQDDEILASLCSIDLGFDKHGYANHPNDQPYARVVQAELASEAMGAA